MSQSMSQQAASNTSDCDDVQLEEVYVVVDANGGFSGQNISFNLEPADGKPGGSYFNEGVLDFRRAGKKKFNIHFLLQNRGGSDLRFMSSVEEAIWIKEDGPCPIGPSQDKNEFPSGAVSPDRMQLTIENLNKKRKRFVYTLRFEPADGGAPVPYDPVIENGGGNDLC